MNENERVPIGTQVLYHGVPHVVRGYDDPAEHPNPRVREVAAEEYEDGTGYYLWPADVPYKFGNRGKATSWVRRKAFEMIEPDGKVSPDTSGGTSTAHDVTAFAEWTDSATLVVWCRTCHAEIDCFHDSREVNIGELAGIADKHARERNTA